jgi:hypothetical protein
MNRKSKTNAIGAEIRIAFQKASEEVKGPFKLSGRGHEARCTFNRRLSAYVRGMDIPHVYISGFGPNKFYARRVVIRAAEIVNKKMGRQIIHLYEDSADVPSMEEPPVWLH